MYYVLCIMYYVLCIMYYVLCIMYYVLCIMYYVLCIMQYVIPFTKRALQKQNIINDIKLNFKSYIRLYFYFIIGHSTAAPYTAPQSPGK